MLLGTIQEYLTNSPKSNLFIIDQPVQNSKLQGIVTQLGYEYIYLNGEEINTSSDFWTQIQDRMNFPSYFGFNWNAVFDCITDLSWYKSKHFFIYYEKFSSFAEQDGEQFVSALKTLKDATLYIDANTTLVILISGEIRSLPSFILSPIFTDMK